MGEFERQGNTYASRVKDFATANDEYGGNNYLSEYFNNATPYKENSDGTFTLLLDAKKDDSKETEKKSKASKKKTKDELYSEYTDEQANDLRELDQAIEEIKALVEEDLIEKEELDNLIETKKIIIETYNI
jgi:hypothetical protein